MDCDARLRQADEKNRKSWVHGTVSRCLKLAHVFKTKAVIVLPDFLDRIKPNLWIEFRHTVQCWTKIDKWLSIVLSVACQKINTDRMGFLGLLNLRTAFMVVQDQFKNWTRSQNSEREMFGKKWRKQNQQRFVEQVPSSAASERMLFLEPIQVAH